MAPSWVKRRSTPICTSLLKLGAQENTTPQNIFFDRYRTYKPNIRSILRETNTHGGMMPGPPVASAWPTCPNMALQTACCHATDDARHQPNVRSDGNKKRNNLLIPSDCQSHGMPQYHLGKTKAKHGCRSAPVRKLPPPPTKLEMLSCDKSIVCMFLEFCRGRGSCTRLHERCFMLPAKGAQHSAYNSWDTHWIS